MAAEALEQSMLESKDKDQLLAIATALGITANARVAKATLITKILETTGSGPDESPAPVGATTNGATSTATPRTIGTAGTNGVQPAPPAPAHEVVLGPDGEPLPDWEADLIKNGELDPAGSAASRPSAPRPNGARNNGGGGARPGAPARGPRPASADGEADDGGDDDDDDGSGNSTNGMGDGESRNARRRRRRRGKPRTDGPQGYDRQDARQVADRGDSSEPQNFDPVAVAGYLDLREEGYGFLRVNGYLASREDAYIPVKLTRQYGLRKGDHVTGMSRPAGRNEKNPALLEIHTVNDADPEKARGRRRFEDLTALFPDEKLNLENAADPGNMTARIVDLVSPIGKGQRGIIVSPPKAGKTTIMKTIATSIEANNPEVKLIVLLIDERPEEVTDMRRTVKGEVISSTFDRPSDEHTQVAELALEKAKRLVEMGNDVVIILDGITRLSRAYNLAAPASGRILSGGIDAGALYPPKRFFGAARNVEEGGSLTILATALVETNSRMDEAIFEEFKGTGNMELRLDRRLAERRIYPAIDVDASSTRHEELLFDRKQLQMVWKLRRVLSGLAADGNAAPGLELLMDRLRTFRTNDEFLNEIAKQPSM